jgi:hypothetical protein
MKLLASCWDGIKGNFLPPVIIKNQTVNGTTGTKE